MKKIIAFVVVILAGFSIYWFLLRTKETAPKEEKQVAMVIKKHSAAFNSSVDNVMFQTCYILDFLKLLIMKAHLFTCKIVPWPLMVIKMPTG